MSTVPPFQSNQQTNQHHSEHNNDGVHPTRRMPSREAVDSLIERASDWFMALPSTGKAVVVGLGAIALLSTLSLLLRLITLLVGLLILAVVLFVLYQLFLKLYQEPE
jgi:divalent metal cation (Fe/Co/Zn/Cd) transporter